MSEVKKCVSHNDTILSEFDEVWKDMRAPLIRD